MKRKLIEQYINFIIELLMIDEVKIEFVNSVNDALCYPTERLIVVPLKQDFKQLLESIAHELRHQYQFDLVTLQGSSEEVAQFEDNFKNYKHIGEEGYCDQFVEIDAFAFSKYIFEKIFGLKITFSDRLNPNKIDARIAEIKNEFSDHVIGTFLLLTGFDPGKAVNIMLEETNQA